MEYQSRRAHSGRGSDLSMLTESMRASNMEFFALEPEVMGEVSQGSRHILFGGVGTGCPEEQRHSDDRK